MFLEIKFFEFVFCFWMDRVNGYYWKIFEDFNKFGKVFLVVGVFGVVGCYEDVFFGFKVKFFEDVVFFFCY